MNTPKAWIALTAASLLIATGCKESPEPVTEVPPPAPSYEPQPLPPVAIEQGQPQGNPGDYAEPQPMGPAPAPVGGAQMYTIQKGDTLWSIATRVYGDGQKWVAISQANPSIDPQKLPVGKQIVLP